MKIILQQDVPGQGKKGELVSVSDGYARNYLFPRKMAVEATPGALNTYKLNEKAKVDHQAREKGKSLAAAEKLKTCNVKISAKAGAGGRLFGAVTSTDIADALKSQFGVELDKRSLVITEPIKHYGVYKLKAKLGHEVSTELSVEVGAF